jgi:hypothetical protein
MDRMDYLDRREQQYLADHSPAFVFSRRVFVLVALISLFFIRLPYKSARSAQHENSSSKDERWGVIRQVKPSSLELRENHKPRENQVLILAEQFLICVNYIDKTESFVNNLSKQIVSE